MTIQITKCYTESYCCFNRAGCTVCSTYKGTKNARAPTKYASDGPSLQNRAEDAMGPNALAKAPRDRWMPKATPFSLGLFTLAATMDVIAGVTIAEPETNKKLKLRRLHSNKIFCGYLPMQ